MTVIRRPTDNLVRLVWIAAGCYFVYKIVLAEPAGVPRLFFDFDSVHHTINPGVARIYLLFSLLLAPIVAGTVLFTVKFLCNAMDERLKRHLPAALAHTVFAALIILLTVAVLAFKEEVKTLALSGRPQWSALVAQAKEESIADEPTATIEIDENGLVTVPFEKKHPSTGEHFQPGENRRCPPGTLRTSIVPKWISMILPGR